MPSSPLAAQLASLTGLDQDTAASQLLPHLDSLPTPGEVKDYLGSLLGSTPASTSFTASYLSRRFRSHSSASSSSSAFPPPPPSSSAPLSKRWASPASSAAPSRAPSPPPPSAAQQKERLEQAFKGAGGRVYVKEKEEDVGGWGAVGGKKAGGGSGSGQGSRASSAQRSGSGAATPALAPPVPVVVPSPSSSPAPSAAGSAKGKGKSSAPSAREKTKEEEDLGVELSEAAVLELGEIARALKSFEAPSRSMVKRGGCFCQARLHPLSPYAPSCPSCFLPLCALNPPALPCPSCSLSPLLPSAVLAAHIADLQSRRESLIEREKARAQREREQEARERAAIRFPELGADYTGVDRRQHQAGYAAHAAGMATGRAVAGAGAARKEAEVRAREEQQRARQKEGTGKVLRLGANGKVKVQTKRLVPVPGKPSKSHLVSQTVSELDPAADLAHDGPAEERFVDEDDDFLRGQVAAVSARAEREGWARLVEQREEGRGWVRVTLPEEERPLYIPTSSDSATLVDPPDDSPAASTAAASSPAVEQPAPVRAAVPGAAAPNRDGERPKRRRGRGGKGEKERQEREGRKQEEGDGGKGEKAAAVEAPEPAAGGDGGWAE
ncbi:hypothetical protein JCM8097_004479 [Rhodosporidiobolus ruineniae]